MSTAEPVFRANWRGNLTEGSIRAHLVRLSVPMVWGILAIVSFQLVDAFYISLLGTDSLAAISFTFPVTMTIFSLIIGMGIGLSSVVARRIGSGHHHDVVRIATHGIILAAMVAVTLSAAGLIVMNPLFRAMGASSTMLPMIRDYMTIWFAGIVFITIPVVGNSAIRATGDTLWPALSMMFAAGLNALLAPFLVFGLAGFPRLEIQGAALATVISYILAMGLSLYVLYARKRIIFRGGLDWPLFGDSAKAILNVALPAGIASLIQPFTQGVITGLMAAHGAHAVAAYGVATRIEAMAFVIVMALATGMSPILGQNFGAGRDDRVRETLKLSLMFCVVWSAFVALVLGLFAQPIASAFSKDPEVVHYAALYFWIVPFSYAFGNLVQGWGSALNALGESRRAAMMIAAKMLALQIPAAFLGGHFYGAAGVFGAMAAVNVVTGLYFHVHHWRFLTRTKSA